MIFFNLVVIRIIRTKQQGGIICTHQLDRDYRLIHVPSVNDVASTTHCELRKVYSSHLLDLYTFAIYIKKSLDVILFSSVADLYVYGTSSIHVAKREN
jgi:hypothetical protein